MVAFVNGKHIPVVLIHDVEDNLCRYRANFTSGYAFMIHLLQVTSATTLPVPFTTSKFADRSIKINKRSQSLVLSSLLLSVAFTVVARCCRLTKTRKARQQCNVTRWKTEWTQTSV